MLKKLFLTSIVFMLNSTLVYSANENDICTEFKHSSVDPSLLQKMLTAAEDGYLYQILPLSSRMGLCVDSPVGRVEANFRRFSGGLALLGDQGESLVSIDAESLESQGFFVENLMKSESFFDVENYRDIIFASTGFEWINNKQAVLKGDLTMKGVTRQVAFYVEITPIEGKDMIQVKATTTVERSAFGLYSLLPAVSDRVNLCMSVEAERYRLISQR